MEKSRNCGGPGEIQPACRRFHSSQHGLHTYRLYSESARGQLMDSTVVQISYYVAGKLGIFSKLPFTQVVVDPGKLGFFFANFLPGSASGWNPSPDQRVFQLL